MKEKNAQVTLLQGLFGTALYKRSQGRIARQVTCGAIGVTVAVGSYKLSQVVPKDGGLWQYAVPGLLLMLGWWISYRVVNFPKFADFLISVEGEMAKVSWPSRDELVRSSIVVILTIFFFAAVLFAYDIIWKWLLEAIGVI